MSQPAIGLKVIEKPTELAPLIQPAPFTNLGIVGNSVRGVPGKTVTVTSINQAIDLLGGIQLDRDGVRQLDRAFSNARPYSFTAYFTRVTGAGYTAASSTVSTGQTKFILAPSDVAVTASVAIAAGANPNTVTITVTGTVNAVPTVETYTNLKVDEVVPAINYGTGIYQKSQMIRVQYYGGLVLPVTPNTAVNAITGLSVGSGTNITLSMGQFGQEDPGTWGNDYAYSVDLDNNNPASRLITIYKKVNGQYLTVGIAIGGLTKTNQKSKLDLESAYVRIATLASTSGMMNPTNGIIDFTGGVDGAAASVTNYVNALQSFNQKPVQAITIAETLASDSDTLTFLRNLDSYCEATKSTTLGFIAWNKSSLTALENTGVQSLVRAKSYVISYLGYETVDDGEGGTITISPVGALYGRAWIKKMFDKSGLPFDPPGGYTTALLGTIDITTPDLTEEDLKYLVRNLSVNPIQRIEGVGFVVRTTRTMSNDNRYIDIHKRRSVNYIADSFTKNLGFVEQEPNTPELRAKLTTTMRLFLNELYNRGMFHTEGGFDGSVAIKCDEENNSPTDVAQRKLTCDLTVWIVDTTESAEIILRSSDRGPLTAEII